MDIIAIVIDIVEESKTISNSYERKKKRNDEWDDSIHIFLKRLIDNSLKNYIYITFLRYFAKDIRSHMAAQQKTEVSSFSNVLWWFILVATLFVTRGHQDTDSKICFQWNSKKSCT